MVKKTFNVEGTSYEKNLTSLSEDCQENSRASKGLERLFRRTAVVGSVATRTGGS